MLLLRLPVQRACFTVLASILPLFIHQEASLAIGPGHIPGGGLTPCGADRNCVSSNYQEPPNRYVSSLQLVKDRGYAFRRAIQDLSKSDAVQVVDILPTEHYIHLTVPGTTPSSLDDIELLFLDSIVQLRCEARVTLPVPPFCLKRNCINGNMDQRTRVGTVARIVGLPYADQQQMQKAKWTPIFFNADRVPDFDEDGEY